MPTEKDIRRYSFTTGAYITPIYYEGKYVWMVSSFEDDTFCGGELMNPDTRADSVEELADRIRDEEDDKEIEEEEDD